MRIHWKLAGILILSSIVSSCGGLSVGEVKKVDIDLADIIEPPLPVRFSIGEIDSGLSLEDNIGAGRLKDIVYKPSYYMGNNDDRLNAVIPSAAFYKETQYKTQTNTSGRNLLDINEIIEDYNSTEVTLEYIGPRLTSLFHITDFGVQHHQGVEWMDVKPTIAASLKMDGSALDKIWDEQYHDGSFVMDGGHLSRSGDGKGPWLEIKLTPCDRFAKRICQLYVRLSPGEYEQKMNSRMLAILKKKYLETFPNPKCTFLENGCLEAAGDSVIDSLNAKIKAAAGS